VTTRLGGHLSMTKHTRGDVIVIALDGSLDSGTAPQVQADLTELARNGTPVLIDMSRMSYMSSAGLRVLLLMYREAEQAGSRLALAGVPPDTYVVMAATGFLHFFTVAETIDDGITVLTT